MTEDPESKSPVRGTSEYIRAEYEWSNVDPSTAVVESVAVALNRPPDDLPPLYEKIDPNALNELLRTDRPSNLFIEFTYQGVPIKVDRAGYVRVGVEAGS